MNPAAAVRGPKHVVTKGATLVLSPAEARRLLEAIDTGTLAGLRDRALVSVMLYSCARVSAVIGMRRQDYFRQGLRGWLRLYEKGGSRFRPLRREPCIARFRDETECRPPSIAPRASPPPCRASPARAHAPPPRA